MAMRVKGEEFEESPKNGRGGEERRENWSEEVSRRCRFVFRSPNSCGRLVLRVSEERENLKRSLRCCKGGAIAKGRKVREHSTTPRELTKGEGGSTT